MIFNIYIYIYRERERERERVINNINAKLWWAGGPNKNKKR